MYIVGIDVGGTNTDAALIQGGRVVAMAKTATDHQRLFASTSKALKEVLKDFPGGEAVELHLSTTLSTNTIVEGRGTATEVVAVPGPGVNLASLKFPFAVTELSGYIDHRGREVASLCREELAELKKALDKRNVPAVAVVGKFSHRNPKHEKEIGALFSTSQRAVSLGHRLSGRANFPRRLMTAYLNASVSKQQSDFAAMWQDLKEQSAVPLQDIYILKADGGTMTLPDSKKRPVETILSGPAASIMGARALTRRREENMVIVDIGGTTTDIAVVVQNEPLFERSGAVISGYKTLVPALLTRSVGLGGDSAVNYKEGRFLIGPQRAGRAVCLGGEKITPTDAAAALGLAAVGDQSLAVAACRKFGGEIGLSWQAAAEGIIGAFSAQLTAAVKKVYGELANEPLYTVSEILTPPSYTPQVVVGLGAPAPVFIPRLAEDLSLPYEVLPFTAGANAVGAAAARPTAGLTLHADTELAVMTVPEIGYRAEISRPLFFDLEKARQEAALKTKEYAKSLGLQAADEVYVAEEESFNIVHGFRTAGRIHMVRTQLRPKVLRIAGGGLDEE
ncbi:MAG TPA: hydantoinase/oxoprolinase family protein [Firmicutes bacterium]|nr:hydantoinase/oxoprolinase family protein [Bacillota bacterium]